jgi:hypothetical protein
MCKHDPLGRAGEEEVVTVEAMDGEAGKEDGMRGRSTKTGQFHTKHCLLHSGMEAVLHRHSGTFIIIFKQKQL